MIADKPRAIARRIRRQLRAQEAQSLAGLEPIEGISIDASEAAVAAPATFPIDLEALATDPIQPVRALRVNADRLADEILEQLAKVPARDRRDVLVAILRSKGAI